MATHRRSLWLIILILLVAFLLRVYRFDDAPPGLSLDEVINGIDALRLLETGGFPFYWRDGRPEPLFRFVQAITIALVGPSRLGLRLASLYVGILTVAAASRAGRHFASGWGSPIAAATLTGMIAHIQLSRIAYRAAFLPFALLLFVDTFVIGWRTGKLKQFALAGVCVAASMLSYTTGLITPAVAALGALHQFIFGQRHWRGILIFGLAFLVAITPMIVMLIEQPEMYWRTQTLGRVGGAGLTASLNQLLAKLETAWRSMHHDGDINPQYNVAQSPLLRSPLLYGLMLLGMASCVLRLRRLASWLALGLLGAMLLPVALADEIPHGLRITGELAALPLLVAAGAEPILWLIERLRQPLLRVAWALALAGTLVWGAVESTQVYFAYWQEDIRWGVDGVISAFSWFFETRSLTMAEAIAEQGDTIVYVPLSVANRPSLRYFTLQSHPQVVAPYARLSTDHLSGGRFLMPPWIERASTTFAAFTPDGTLLLLPSLHEETLEGLREAAVNSDEVLYDQYGEIAAIVVDYPEPIPLAMGHRTATNYDNQVMLVGWDAPSELPVSELESHSQVTLYFSPGLNARRDLTVITQLWSLEGQGLSSGRETLLARWLYPPGRWGVDDVVPLEMTLPIPPGLSPGAYHLGVVIHDWRGRSLPVLGVDGLPVAEAAVAGALRMPRSEPISTEGMTPVQAQLGEIIELIGYRITDSDGIDLPTLSPGQMATLTLYWRARETPEADYTIFVHLHDSSEAIVAQHDGQPEGGHYPTGIWGAGEVVATVHPLALPPDTAGPYSIYTGMYTWPDLARLRVVQATAPAEDGRALVVEMP